MLKFKEWLLGLWLKTVLLWRLFVDCVKALFGGK
jgi:hypothetical protein